MCIRFQLKTTKTKVYILLYNIEVTENGMYNT